MSWAPKVTVIIPIYNCERYISKAIESILSQSFTDFELILIDDASTDNSYAIMQSFKDSRIHLTRNDVNLGLAKTHNRGIELARGDYIAILDHDDVSYPKRLERQVTFLDRHKDYALVGASAEIIDERGRTLRGRKPYPTSAEVIRVGLLFRCSIFHPSIMARREIMQQFWYSDRYSLCADFDLFVRLSKEYKLANLQNVLVKHRRHESRTTNQKAHLKKGENIEIFRSQLTDLRVPCSESDLERHFLLAQMKTLSYSPDHEYLSWTESWLDKLQTANQQTSMYTEPAFGRALRDIWLKACWHAWPEVGAAAWKRYRRSPFGKGAFHSLTAQLINRWLSP